MTLCQQQSLTTTGWCIQCNMLIYLVSTYILALSDLKGKIGNANVDLLSFLVLCSSALVFAYDTCNSYRTNGWWIILNFCLIGGSLRLSRKAARPEAARGRLRGAGLGGIDGRLRLTKHSPTATAEPIDKGCTADARAPAQHGAGRACPGGWGRLTPTRGLQGQTHRGRPPRATAEPCWVGPRSCSAAWVPRRSGDLTR